MSRTTRKHVRIYYVDLQRDYPEVFFDPTCLSTWLRLLIASDQAWPSAPVMPDAMRRADLAKLESAGLLAVGPAKQFALKGWQEEREGRAAAGKAGASGRIANAQRSLGERTAIALRGGEDKSIRGRELGSTSPLTHTERPRSQRLVEPVG